MIELIRQIMGDSISNSFALLVLKFYKGKVKSLNSCMSSVFLLFYSEKVTLFFQVYNKIGLVITLRPIC